MIAALTSLQRQVRGRERDAQRAVDQHHHRMRAAGAFGEVFGVAGERMPASLITLFCTGAVTIAANAPARQPSTARSSSVEHVARVGGIGPAGRTAAATGTCRTGSVPARCVDGRSAGPVGQERERCRAAARAASTCGSPAKTSSQGQSRPATRSEVRPDAGGLAGGHDEPGRRDYILYLDVGLVAQSSQPQLGFLVHLASRSARKRAGGALRRSGRACAGPAAGRYASRTGSGTAR